MDANLDLLRQQELDQLNEEKQLHIHNMEIIYNFKTKFMETNNRFPTQDEYISNLYNILNEDTILKLLQHERLQGGKVEGEEEEENIIPTPV